MEEASVSTTGTSIAKSELERIIEEANRQLLEKQVAMKEEEERVKTEREREEMEAMEAKAKERAERKAAREQRHANHKSKSLEIKDPSSSQSSTDPKAKLEKQFSVVACVPTSCWLMGSLGSTFLTSLRVDIKCYLATKSKNTPKTYNS